MVLNDSQYFNNVYIPESIVTFKETNIYDVVCYREREGEVNFPTLLCLNQQALRLTI